MKVFVAVVASVSDYYKDIDHDIDHTSIHTTKKDASEAVMRAIIDSSPCYIALFPVDWKSIIGSEDELGSQGRRNRLYCYMKHEYIIEDYWRGDDVPEDSGEFEKFQAQETAAIAELAKKIQDHLKKNGQISFTTPEIPPLPQGDHIDWPIVWRILEQDIDDQKDDPSSDTIKKDEDLNTTKRAKHWQK